MTREIKLDFDDTGALDLNPENLFRGAEARMSRRKFLSAAGAAALALAACAPPVRELFTPTPTGYIQTTEIPPTPKAPTVVLEETIVAPTNETMASAFKEVTVLGQDESFKVATYGRIFAASYESLVNAWKGKSEFEGFDQFSFLTIVTKDQTASKKSTMYFPFMTVSSSEGLKKPVILQLFYTSDFANVYYSPLIPQEYTLASGKKIPALMLTREKAPISLGLLYDIPVFSYDVSVDEFLAMKPEERAKLPLRFSPFGLGSGTETKRADISADKIQNIAFAATPETPKPTEVQEYVPGGIIFEETISGVDLEISPEADTEGIYNTIAASFVRFLNKDQNKGAWQEVLKDHPEWGHITNSEAEEIRTEAMTAFLKKTGGRIYINFMGGSGYTREGWVDLNNGIVFKAGEVTAEVPTDHVRLALRTAERTEGQMVTGAGGKVYTDGERLIFSVLVMPYYLKDDTLRLNWENEGMVASFCFAKLIEFQADQSVPNNLNLKEPHTTNVKLFLWGSGNESFWPYIQGFTRSFLVSTNK